MQSPEKVIETVNKIDEEKSTAEYVIKEKEKNVKLNANDFNKITFIEYDLFNRKNYEIDFLFDYSKILGPDKNDTKLIQWQMLNKDRLFPYGIDIAILNQRINEIQASGTNKMDNIISNLNYRLQRHGRLAPTKDIARKLQKKTVEEQMPLAEEDDEDKEDIDIEHEETLEDKTTNNNNKEKDKNNNNVYNGNEENFYDINDPFIDDNLDEISEMDNNKLLFDLSLAPGNYTENEILQNLKNHKVKKFKKIKKVQNSKKSAKINKKNENTDDNNINENQNINSINNDRIKPKTPCKITSDKSLLSKKTKREPSYNSHNSDNEKNRKKRKFDKSQLTDMSLENINKLFNQLKSEYSSPINNDQQKVSFINRNIKNIAEIYSRNPSDLCRVVQKEFNISLEIANMLIEHMIFKSKIENYYSNFSKYLRNLNVALKGLGISKIASLSDLIKYSNTDNEIEKSIKHVIDNIYNFRNCFNEYIGRHYNDLSDIHEKLRSFIKDIKERNKGIIMKISSKFDESEKDFGGIITREIIIQYLKYKYTSINFSRSFSDENNRIYSLDDFVYKDKGNEVKILNESNNDVNTSEELETFNNLSFHQEISTSVGTPKKSYGKSNGNISNSKYIDLPNKINKKKYP